ncbi:unnamed protein product [Pylaiella littoralis]
MDGLFGLDLGVCLCHLSGSMMERWMRSVKQGAMRALMARVTTMNLNHVCGNGARGSLQVLTPSIGIARAGDVSLTSCTGHPVPMCSW